jgi:undecaprenyl-diphosphatase
LALVEGQVTDVDARILAALNALRQPWLDAFFAAVTWLGSIVVLLPAAFALAWRLQQRGQGRAALLLPSAVSGAWALAHLGKVLIERPRPDLFPAVIAMPADPSFPSAHAMQVTAFALAWLLAPHQRRGWTQIITTAILALLIAISRLYLQVHFPSDVWIGMLVATAWVLGLRLALMGRA